MIAEDLPTKVLPIRLPFHDWIIIAVMFVTTVNRVNAGTAFLSRACDYTTPMTARSASRAKSPGVTWDLSADGGPAWPWADFSTCFDHDR
jgi:hypothetical protein